MKTRKKKREIQMKNPVVSAILVSSYTNKNKHHRRSPMRQKRTRQMSIFEIYSQHQIGKELQAMSDRLDQCPQILDWIAIDLHRRDVLDTGRKGLPVETVLRCALLKQYRQLSYEELAFHLSDSASFRAFARLPLGMVPKKSVLQETISQIRPYTWECINQCLVGQAKEEKVESGNRVRFDSTATEAMIHEPSDSSLLSDSVRVMVRLLKRAQSLAGELPIAYCNHLRLARKRARAIIYTRKADKKTQLYKDLIQATRDTLGYLLNAESQLSTLPCDLLAYEWWLAEWQHYRPLIEKVIWQSEQRVVYGQSLAAEEKVFSIFEEHTDIIIKGSREIQYGHKLNLSSGKSGLILDVVIEEGNPADSERLLPMLERHIQHFGVAPTHLAVDGGYASEDNLTKAKGQGVKQVAFHKKRGLSVEQMVSSNWIYRQLRNFRAGIEAGISCLKRAYGLARCTWKGLEHFKSYVWSSVVAYNLALLARLKPA
jgi:IS5 family transposase